MRKRRREAERLIASLGLTIVDVRVGNHHCYRLRNEHGLEVTMPVSLSPSDLRSAQNTRRQLRRLAQARTYEEYRPE